MKPSSLLFGCVALAAFLSCDDISAPDGPVPPPVLVPFSALPHPFSEATYRANGRALSEGPVSVLETLVHEGFAVEVAWYPQISLCGAVFLDELIVQLEEPNDDILGFGFSRDFSGTSGPCSSHWNEYRFTE